MMTTVSILSGLVIVFCGSLTYWCFAYLHGSIKTGLWKRKHRLSTAGTAIMVAAGPFIAITRSGWIIYTIAKDLGRITDPPPELILMSGASWVVLLVGVHLWLVGEMIRLSHMEGPLAP